MAWQSELVTVIQNAVKDQGELDLILLGLNRRSSDYVTPGAFPQIADQVVGAAARENWAREFVRELLWHKPANQMLQNFRDENRDVSPTRLREKEADDLREGLDAAFRSPEELEAVVRSI